MCRLSFDVVWLIDFSMSHWLFIVAWLLFVCCCLLGWLLLLLVCWWLMFLKKRPKYLFFDSNEID
jgi:hypothetical protein